MTSLIIPCLRKMSRTRKIMGNWKNESKFVKDAFHEAVISNRLQEYNQQTQGTKVSLVCDWPPPGWIKDHSIEIDWGYICKALLLIMKRYFVPGSKMLMNFMPIFNHRSSTMIKTFNARRLQVWSGQKQFYHIDDPKWLKWWSRSGTSTCKQKDGRNSQWHSLNNADIISMPDKWEYPWYAAWDLAFHRIPWPW